MEKLRIDFSLPTSWSALTDRQLRYIYSLMASDFTTDAIKTLCFLRFSATEVIGRNSSGAFLVRKEKIFFEIHPLDIAQLLPAVGWIDEIPAFPVRPDRIRRRRRALPADFSEVPFETFIICDNIYQGYLQTSDDNLLDQLGEVLYPGARRFSPWQRIAIFYWMASLKAWLASKYSDFFQPPASAGDNLLGSPSLSVEAAMNAQIRALTKGDITKEAQVLALDTHRALTELNAQAREYKELNSKIKK
ncbi:MAG: hypothetical protein HDS21_00100 [Bacteroides sp.]|nr:hypothetical protein [Bacteroides sp.]